MSLLDKIFPQPDPPFETQPIVGFRAWKLRESPEGVPGLYSITRDFQWLPFEPAYGNLDGDGGIYAYKAPADICEHSVGDCIAGEVFLWGNVLEHDEGYRAEYGYPKELWVSKDFDAAMIVRLEETYGVPVVIKEAPPQRAHPPTAFRGLGATASNTAWQSPLTSGLGEFIVDTIYDREMLTRPCTNLFCTPVGQCTIHIDGVYKPKNYNRTNMWMPRSLPAPERFLIKSIRCAFFEEDGSLVPVTDPIYWEAFIELNIQSKKYWRSPTAYVADPANLLAATDWSKIPQEERLTLIDLLRSGNSITCGPVKFNTFNLPGVDGIMLEQQVYFSVKIDSAEKWEGKREVMVGLEGICGRAVL